jgi:nitroreductase/NAD-dependent dihydropyrimidine dehydrogenase PreA subunit
MPLFTIDSRRCKACGLCVQACPAGLVRQQAPEAMPSPLPGREANCILCGHCLAACPSGAFEHGLLPGKGLEPIRRRDLPGFTAVASLLKARRSCRHFRPEPLSHEDLAELFRVADFAPTGHNTRQVGFVVVEGQGAMARVREGIADWMRAEVRAETPLAATLHLAGSLKALAKGKDVVLRRAPNLVVAHAPEPGLGVTPEIDAVIAVSWLEIAAQAKGLGACWCGYLMFALAGHPPLAELLIPKGRRGYAALLLGRPAWRYTRIPPRGSLPVSFF